MFGKLLCMLGLHAPGRHTFSRYLIGGAYRSILYAREGRRCQRCHRWTPRHGFRIGGKPHHSARRKGLVKGLSR